MAYLFNSNLTAAQATWKQTVERRLPVKAPPHFHMHAPVPPIHLHVQGKATTSPEVASSPRGSTPEVVGLKAASAPLPGVTGELKAPCMPHSPQEILELSTLNSWKFGR